MSAILALARIDGKTIINIRGTHADAHLLAGCRLFVSIHLNDVESDLANGLEVLYRDSEDRVLAERLLTALLPITGIRDRGVKQRTDLAVLKFDGPVALIELGFIGNDHDRGKLLDPQVRDSACNAIAAEIIAYLSKP